MKITVGHRVITIDAREPIIERRPALFVDLDGTIRRPIGGVNEFIKGAWDIELLPNSEEILWKWKEEQDYLVFGISNQGGVACGFKTHDQVVKETLATLKLFNYSPFDWLGLALSMDRGNRQGINGRSVSRKPGAGMVALAEQWADETLGVVIDYEDSIFVGDRPEDEMCALRAGLDFRQADVFFRRTTEVAS